ncbi:MAG: MFS transporter, partial [Chloroflexi bacterium]|nr:MFS transporter [Chloroflexota bacterium]
MIEESWRRNLAAIIIAELIVIIGLNSVNPFLPLFVQQMGEFSNREAAFWAGIVTGASGIAMFISAPLWGLMADRWGRKPMLLRSLFGAAIVASLT